MFYEGINIKVFRRTNAFAITVVVTSHSSSFDYTISVHAVHAGAEKYCSIYWNPPNFHQSISSATPRLQTSTLTTAPPKVLTSKTPTTFSSAFAQMRYRCKYQVSFTGQNILEVYIIYLHVYMLRGSIFFYVWRTNKGCHVHVLCKMLLFWAKTSKTSAYSLCFYIKLKKSRSGFDLVTVLISKQSFFSTSCLACLAR